MLVVRDISVYQTGCLFWKILKFTLTPMPTFGKSYCRFVFFAKNSENSSDLVHGLRRLPLTQRLDSSLTFLDCSNNKDMQLTWWESGTWVSANGSTHQLTEGFRWHDIMKILKFLFQNQRCFCYTQSFMGFYTGAEDHVTHERGSGSGRGYDFRQNKTVYRSAAGRYSTFIMKK